MRIAFYKMERTRTVKDISYKTIENLMQLDDVEILDCLEGSLLDNFLLAIGENYAIAQETYLNCWSSCYTLIYGNCDKIQDRWDNLRKEYEEI